GRGAPARCADGSRNQRAADGTPYEIVRRSESDSGQVGALGIGVDSRRDPFAALAVVAAVPRCRARCAGRGRMHGRKRGTRMMKRFRKFPAFALVSLMGALLALGGCESIGPTGKRIDYKSTSATPTLELPPDLTTPRYDDRFALSSANQLAAANASGPKRAELLPTNSDARIARAGSERWIVAKASPEQAWSVSRQFWNDTGFVIAVEQPAIGMMETDWAENRADLPATF